MPATATIATEATASPLTNLNALLKNKKSAPEEREDALKNIRALFGAVENEGLLVQEGLPALLKAADDKAASVRALASELMQELVESVRNWGSCNLVDILIAHIADEIKWRTKIAALELLSVLANTRPKMIALCLPNIIPALGELLFAIKKEVKAAANITLDEVVKVVENRDIEPAVPSILHALRTPEEVEETIHILASTTFVADVYASALSIIVPLLVRGFAIKKTAVRRQCSVIISNMYKLVNDPAEGAPFLPQLLPILEKMADEISDPEARGVATKAFNQLQRIQKAVHGVVPSTEDEIEKMNAALVKETGVKSAGAKYAADVAGFLSFARNHDKAVWQEVVAPLLSFAKNSNKTLDVLFALCSKPTGEEEEEEEEDAEELCNCKFTLAYGTKVLLHNTQLKLKRGYRYGLCGQNDCGKTTLMRSMANASLEGFPSDLRTVFVEADIQGEMSHLCVLDYVFTDKAIQACDVAREDVSAMLSKVGFTEKMQNDPITSLSGGWRMKLALARAMLQKADILLMDEPSNHLDVINVAWLKQYINSLKDVTCIMVSHDTGLLNDCCTHIIQITDLKLKMYKGNLDSFLEKVPEAKSFFELTTESSKSFSFPAPGFLEGVKSKGKALMKMTNVDFTYPGNDKPTLTGITVQVSLSSRVACVGVNGAGKSTLIKILTGELQPTSGNVWKHNGVRVAYVAQHAFHHIESHLTKSANEYIRWRYQYGEDREGLQKVTMVLTEEEEAHLAKPIPFQIQDDKGKTKTIHKTLSHLTGNRKQGKKGGFEYEVHWKDTTMEANTWMTEDKLETLGFIKLVKQAASKAEARERMYSRPLTSEFVEKHLVECGLEAEYATHTRMSALSGGQKVKVVIAAAMWNQPHICILDEPTNYLDRESLSALAGAIKKFEGGVVIISHNDQFCSALCPETWVLEHGKLDARGDAEWMKKAASTATNFEMIDEMVDGNGNVVKVKGPKKNKLTRKEKKQRELRRKQKLELGEPLSSDDEDDF